MKRIACVLFSVLISGSALARFSLYLDNQIPVSAERVTCMKISPNGRFLALADNQGTIYLWDLNAKRKLHELKGHRGKVNALIFDTQNQRLLSAGDDRNILVWDLYSGQQENKLSDFRNSVLTLSLSPDDRFLAAGGRQKDILLWEFPSGVLKGRLAGHKRTVFGLAFSVNGDQLLSVSEDKQLILWNPQTRNIIRKTSIEARTLSGSGLDIQSADFSFDRQFAGIGIQEHILAKGGRSMIFKYNLSFYDWNTGAEIATLSGNRKDIETFAITPDKQYAVTDNSTLQNPELAVWHIQKGIIEQTIPLDGDITFITFSKDAKWLAAACEDPSNRFQSRVNVW
ncbi:MAG TPA: WD40 repeat domain-containing protein, partial [bacterium]|nr:WD40 repeat domain-containing protein [bacterium]